MSVTETIKATVQVTRGPALCLFFFKEDGYYYATGEADKATLTGYVGAAHIHQANLDRLWSASSHHRIVLVEAHGNYSSSN